jgi:hypothetical protein
MRANNINGEIKLFNTLPSTWNGKKHYMGGFASSPVEVLEEEGFYEVVDPQYDPAIEELGELYLEDNKYYYTVIQKTWSETLAELKENKINDLNNNTQYKLQETDWYYIRKLDRNIDVPQQVEDERAIILNNHNDHETAINALTKKTDVVKYEFE